MIGISSAQPGPVDKVGNHKALINAGTPTLEQTAIRLLRSLPSIVALDALIRVLTTSPEGSSKVEHPPETRRVSGASLSPANRLLHDIASAVESADVPMSEYATLDARELGRIIPPALLAKAARSLLVQTQHRWKTRLVTDPQPFRRRCRF